MEVLLLDCVVFLLFPQWKDLLLLLPKMASSKPGQAAESETLEGQILIHTLMLSCVATPGTKTSLGPHWVLPLPPKETGVIYGMVFQR